MTLASEYERQYAWRAWDTAYRLLPGLQGTRVLDLGCAVGDQARDLAGRGACVLGIDANPELLKLAQAKAIPQVEFAQGDVRDPPAAAARFDGIWASFVTAYFPDLAPVLRRWRELLKPGGWIALTEVSGLFAHEPLPAPARSFFQVYARDAFEAGRYDFDMGEKLASHLRACGFDVQTERLLPDAELSFQGHARDDVLQAWRDRLDRMRLLGERAKSACPSATRDFLRCLADDSHTSATRVHFCLARSD